MDRLDELAVFVAIVDHGSLAAAGRALRRSPPAVTRALVELEARVGARLIERTTRRCRPTEAGLRLAEHARQLLTGYAAAVREPAAVPVRGVLRVTAPLVFGRRHVTPVVASFLEAFPAVRVELMLNDRNLHLIDESIDVALRIGALSDSGLVARKVGQVVPLAVASPRYLAGRPPLREPRDLAQHDVVFAATRPGPLVWRFAGASGAQTIRVVPRLTVSEVEAALVAARAGRGVVRALSYQVAEDLAAGVLVRVLVEHEPPPIPVQLVVPSARHLSAKVRCFLDHAAPALAALAVLRA